METDAVKHLENTLQHLFIQITDTHLKTGFSRKGIMAAMTEIIDLAEHIIKRVHSEDTKNKVACGPGCGFCCHSEIKLTPAEALLIFSWLDINFTDHDRNLLQERIKNNQALTHGKNLKERVLIKDSTPCIFLKDDVCIIYPVRPLICRAWTSYSSQSCREAFLSGNHNAEIETSDSSNYVFSLARDAVKGVCHCHGLESEPIELPKAMNTCLDFNDPFDHWLHKIPIFSCNDAYKKLQSYPLLFMETHIPLFFKRFSLSYKRDYSCIEYFLYSLKEKKEISTELIISHNPCTNHLYVSKFYPEIYKEPLTKYMSAVCFFLILHHAASTSGIDKDSFIYLETRCQVFENFYSRLKDFDFAIKYKRPSDNYNIQGIYHHAFVDTSMIKDRQVTAER